MNDLELKKLLLETHPVRPGQEERAWAALKQRLAPASMPAWLYYPTWRGAVVGLLALVVVAFAGDFVVQLVTPVSYASADSVSPGIYATAFYSHSAHAQVVWLNGLNPSTDQPTYLDATTVVPAKKSPDRL